MTEVSQDFDRYWASHSSYTVASIIKKGDIEKGFQELGYNDKDKNETLSRYRSSIENSELYKKMQSNSIDWQSVHTRLITRPTRQRLDRDRHKPPIFDRMQGRSENARKKRLSRFRPISFPPNQACARSTNSSKTAWT